jgi:hypothetical protein
MRFASPTSLRRIPAVLAISALTALGITLVAPTAGAQEPSDGWFAVSPIEPPDHMWGMEWLPDSEVQVDIDDPDVVGTVDFTTNIPTDGDGRFEVYDLPFDIQAGQLVTVSQGDHVKTHEVIDLTITEIDATADTVSGVGAADSLTYVNVGPAPQVVVTSDATGVWTVDLGAEGIDLVPGGTVYVFQADEDWDQTQIDAHVETPGASIQVVPVGDYVDLIGFAPGVVTVTINGTALDPAPDGGSGDERVSLADYGIDLVAGDVVIASQNGSIAEVTTVHVEITGVDSTTGVVSGLAPDGALVNVEAWTDDGSAERVTTANGGAFSVDFSLPGGPSDPNPDVVTLTPGSAVTAFVYDVPHTGDASKHDWQVPEVAYEFVGFGDPVDNEAVNLVTAGRTVPLKFRVTTGTGDPVTDLTEVSVTVTTLQCELGTTTDQIEEYAAGNSGLQNLGDGYYQYNWKTPKSYKNSCKLLTLDIGDGVAHTANFHFIR